MLTRQRIEEIIDTPLKHRDKVDAALAAAGVDDIGLLMDLDNMAVLKGDWRRSAVRRRLDELRKAINDYDEDGEQAKERRAG